MKKAFIITSGIELDNSKPLTYSKIRTCFDTVDRFRHTVMTVASLDHVAEDDDTMFLVDMSENWESFRGVFSYQKNLVYVSVREEFPEIYEEVRSHPNKSRCETLLLSTFLSKYKDRLSLYDYFFKVSGRYFVDGSFNSNLFVEENINKLFFKRPFEHEFNERWNYNIVDLRNSQGNNLLYQYPTTFFGWGKLRFDEMLDLFRVLEIILKHPLNQHYDIETLIYYFTRHFEQDIVPVDWTVYGWDGCSGGFLRY